MKQSIITRLDKLSAKLGANALSDCFCTMRDGKKRIMPCFSTIEPLQSGDIIKVETADPNFYNFFGGLYPITLRSRI